jgi:hypothetical protein
VIVDDAYPYRLYSGQQDNSSVIIKSRSDGPTISASDWQNGPGCESANIGVDRKTPRYVYGGCYQGIFEEMDMETGLTRQIMAWPALSLTEPTNEIRYRFNWTSPSVVSQHDSRVIYHGGNVLFRTMDRGKTWAPISPDLTRNDKATQGWGGTPITNEGAGGEVYGTIVAIAESRHDANTIYVGTDDGLVQLTRDGGKSWTNVTPAGVPVGLANKVEASPNDPATVYLAFRMDRHGDYTPYAYKSTDYGKTWTLITKGLRAGEPVRVVREDPAKRGLLYAGTETGVYISFDGGGNWQSLSRNLPAVPIADLDVRHDDLYAATEGRAFWALDDLSALRQLSPQMVASPAHLFTPRAALRGGGPSPATTSAGRNPPSGANIYYWLASAPDSTTDFKLEFLDGAGKTIRTFEKSKPAAPGSPAPTPPGPRLEPKAGLNAFQWNLRANPPTALPGNISMFGGPTDGYLIPPGQYQVRMTYATTTQTDALEVLPDPRLATPAAEIAAHDSLAKLINTRVGEINESLIRLRDVKDQIAKFVERSKDAPNAPAIAAQGKLIGEKTDTLGPKLSTKAANGQDIINYRNGINAQYVFLLGNLEGNDIVTQPVRDRLVELEKLWSALRTQVETIEQQDVPELNKLLEAGKVDGVIVPKPKPKVIM